MSKPYKEIFVYSAARTDLGTPAGSAVFVQQQRGDDKVIIATDGDFRIDPATLSTIARVMADDITPTN